MDIATGAVIMMGLRHAVPPAADVVKTFLTKILTPPGEALGEALAHPIIEWQKRRVKRAEETVNEAAKLLTDAGVEPEHVPGRVLMPLLEKASMEEDPTLHQRWVRLLASAASAEGEVLPAFVSILGELTATEVRVLDWIFASTARKLNDGREYFAETSIYDVCSELRLDKKPMAILIGNLVRLGLLVHPFEVDSYWVDSIIDDRQSEARGYSRSPRPDIEAMRIETKFSLTDLGAAFVAACSRRAT